MHPTMVELKKQLQQVGWSKATELVKVARRDEEEFDCATWLHKAIPRPRAIIPAICQILHRS
jgi:hypothetical protein